MAGTLKETVRKWARSAGWEVRRYGVDSSAELRLARFLQLQNIDCVLDVGANAGQFAGMLRRAGFHGTIVSFEPLAAAHQALQDASRQDEGWILAPRMALGAGNGQVEIHVAGNSASSSVLAMMDTHLAAAPASSYVTTETVPLRRLDDVTKGLVPEGARLLLKLDVQGYEAEVLRGAPQTAAQARAALLEMSLVPLYDGQPLFDEMFHTMQRLGFEVWSFDPTFRHPESGRLLQVDALFVRANPAAG